MYGRRKKPLDPALNPTLDTDAKVAPRRPKTPGEQRDDLLSYAFRALGQKALSARELRLKLERRSEDAQLIHEVLSRVQELGYQQDTQVAQIEAKRRGVGRFQVRQNLKRRGLEPELIDETLSAIDPDKERGAALDLLTRRWAGLARKRDPRASAYALLARRGFGSGVIWDVIREVSALPSEDDESPPEDDEGHLSKPEDD